MVPGQIETDFETSTELTLIAAPYESEPEYAVIYTVYKHAPLVVRSTPVEQVTIAIFDEYYTAEMSAINAPIVSVVTVSRPISAVHYDDSSVAA